MSKIMLNIVEPGSPTPVDPGIDPAVPDTGLFTHGIGGTEATIIVSAVLILAIVGMILAVFMYRKHKKVGKITKLVHIVDQTKAVIKSKKRIAAGLAAISLLVSAGTFMALTKNGVNATDADNQAEDGLTVNVSDEELTIEVKDQPVFAVLPVQVTVEEATKAGYTLTAHTDNTDLVSTTNPNNKIPMVTVEGDELTSLQDNTWGLALDNEPEAKDNKVYKALSTDQTNPTIIKTIDDYSETEANDTTTIYYGFYITPDVPYGTYTGGEVEYEAEENKVATVTFDGNGLYFNGDEGQTANVMKYVPGKRSTPQYSHTPNVNDDGAYSGKYGTNLDETFVYDFPGYEKTYIDIVRADGDTPWAPNNDYFSVWSGKHPNYTAKEDWNNDDSIKEFDSDGQYKFASYLYSGKAIIVDNDAVTLAYTTDNDGGCCGGNGYGYYAEVFGFTPNIVTTGSYEVPDSAAVHIFLGWSEDRQSTTPTYFTEEDIINKLNLSDGNVTLYAVWQRATEISFNGNGSDGGDMNSIIVLSGETTTLPQNTFTKDGYVFNGWNANSEGSGESFGDDESTYTAPAESQRLTLYAQWIVLPTIGNLTYMQDFARLSKAGKVSVLGSMIAEQQYQLKDNRDQKEYYISKLADGNVWMTQNLDHDIGDIEGGTYTPDDTDILERWTPSESSNEYTKRTTDWASLTTAPESYDPGDLYWNGIIINDQATCEEYGGTWQYNSMCFDGNRTSSTGNSHYHLGNYYNWTAAVAMSDSSSYTGRTDVNQSICPAGWRLPTYIGDKSYENLASAGNLTVGSSGNIHTAPNYFVYGGDWSADGFYAVGIIGVYWISRTMDENTAYLLDIGINDFLKPRWDTTRYLGTSLRCVAR